MSLLPPSFSRPGLRFLGWVSLTLALAASASARDFRVNQLPNGRVNSCLNCHFSAGGGGPRNPFGQAVQAIVGTSSRAFWTAALAAADADGDGFTNGQELGDPDGDGKATAGADVTLPGDSDSHPAPNAPPEVTLTSPTAGTVFVAPALAAVTAEATDADGQVARVEFYTNGQLLGSVSTAPYTLLVDWALGAHSITAKAIDNQGASTESAAVTMTVNRPEAPTVTAVSRSGLTNALTWTGGGGPFVVQRQAALMDPWCSLGEATTNRTATVVTRENVGFLRVADLAAMSAIPLSAILSGAYERPTAINTTGTGSATFKLEGNTLSFDIQYAGLSGPATLAHIHGPAGPDVSTGVMVDLKPYNGGAFGVNGSLAGSVVLTDAQKAAVLSGKTYVNVHTDANKPGEIRGQILPTLYRAVLNGDNERPNAVASSGGGTALFLLAGDQLTIQVNYQGLSGPATLAHIHGPADSDNAAGVMVDLAPLNGGAFGVSGTLAGTVTLTPDQLVALASGLTYVNVHTDAHKPGEIRGQILPSVTAKPFSVVMRGGFEKPTAVTTTGVGTGILAIEGDTLFFNIRYGGLSGPATLAHIHGPADTSTSAGVMINLAPFNDGGFGVSGGISGSVVLTAEQKAAIYQGRTYVNVHTDANKPGEIRGQVAPVLLTAALGGANEKPTAVNTTATGTGHFLLVGDRLWMNVTYGGLSGAATLAHIHGPADTTVSAGVLVDLAPFTGAGFAVSGSLFGLVPLDGATLSAIVDGLAYVNVHTSANKAGEIRGQVLRTAQP